METYERTEVVFNREESMEGQKLAMFYLFMVVRCLIVILQNIYPYNFVLFCIKHISQLKRKHVGHAWSDPHILRRENNEIRKVDTFVFVILFHELGGEYISFHLLLFVTDYLKYFKSKLKLKEGREFPRWLSGLQIRLVSIRMGVQSLASLSGLRIRCCSEL